MRSRSQTGHLAGEKREASWDPEIPLADAQRAPVLCRQDLRSSLSQGQRNPPRSPELELVASLCASAQRRLRLSQALRSPGSAPRDCAPSWKPSYLPLGSGGGTHTCSRAHSLVPAGLGFRCPFPSLLRMQNREARECCTPQGAPCRPALPPPPRCTRAIQPTRGKCPGMAACQSLAEALSPSKRPLCSLQL